MAEKEKIKNFSIKSYVEYSSKEIENRFKKKPINYLNIISSDKETQEDRFKEIAENLRKFIEKKILARKEKSIYIYQQISHTKIYTGFICGVSTDDYKNKRIKIHEKTIEKRERLFKDYLKSCKIHAEPVLLTHKENKEIEKIIQNKIKTKPLIKFTTNDKKEHSIWDIKSEIEISNLKKQFKPVDLYIADGHHRMASSLLYNTENKLHNKCLAYIISEKKLNLESFHRIVSDITKKQKSNLIKFLQERFTLNEGEINLSVEKNKINIYFENKWYNITLNPTNDKIIVQILSEDILKPFFKIKNIRKSKILTFIPDSKLNLNEIKKTDQVIFFLPSIKMENIFHAAENGKTMPPKSTYIKPKLRTGLIMMELK